MRVHEILKKLDFESIWSQISSNVSKSENNTDGYEAYKNAYNELVNSECVSVGEKDKAIIVARVSNTENEVEYDTSLVSINDKTFESLALVEWYEWISMEILDKSIQFYGETLVAAAIMYEMTFYGFDKESHSKHIEMEKQLMDEALRGDLNNTTTVEMTSILKSIGLDESEVESEVNKYKKTGIANQIIYDALTNNYNDKNISRQSIEKIENYIIEGYVGDALLEKYDNELK